MNPLFTPVRLGRATLPNRIALRIALWLLPHAPRQRGEPAARRHAAAARALDAVGLKGWEHHTPAELSGGQQQRVAIARAIVTEPAVLLADEPTGNLDTQRSHEIMDLLARLNSEQGITVLMVTHEPDMAAYAHRIVRFVDGLVASDERNASPTQPGSRTAAQQQGAG